MWRSGWFVGGVVVEGFGEVMVCSMVSHGVAFGLYSRVVIPMVIPMGETTADVTMPCGLR